MVPVRQPFFVADFPPLNPHAATPVSPGFMVSTLLRHRTLILQMARREIVARYRGSVMGVFWSLLNPLLMLVVYTFVFSVVFKARWHTGAQQSHADFAIILFVGVIVHTLFSEVAGRAPSPMAWAMSRT